MDNLEELRNKISVLRWRNNILRRQNMAVCKHNKAICQYNWALCQKIQALNEHNKDLHQQMEDLRADRHDLLQREVQELRRKLQCEKSQRLIAEEGEQGLNTTVLSMYAKLTSKMQEVEILHDKLRAANIKNCKDTGVIIRSMGDMINAEMVERHQKETHWFHLWFW